MAGDGEPRGHGDPEVRHLGEVRALAAEQVLHARLTLGHVTGELVAVLERRGDLESLYQFACAKIDFLQRELQRNLSQPVAEAGGGPTGGASSGGR